VSLLDDAGSGALFHSEIHEQPDALERLLEHEDEYARVAAEMRARNASLVRMVGHGSSDNAASYGIYAFGLGPRWTALRDAITLTVYYGSAIDLSGSTVVALSQSGRTPDVVEYARRARTSGAFTVALTNHLDSELAAEVEAPLPLAAGDERAVAATKTYLTQVAALGLLAAHAAGDGPRFAADLRRVADQLRELIPALEQRLATVAPAFAYVGRMFVIGRGIEFGTAREIALKLLETSRIGAEALTATDLAHGPVAALDPLFPVWTIASHDETLPAVLEAAGRIKAAGGMLIASGSAADLLHEADYRLDVPTPPQPLLSPLLSAIPGQLFAAAVARAKGLDPDRPAQLSKVTLAR
jgi:glucosamine--fructose-6-phosphate aminotransferase (isomerizing)